MNHERRRVSTGKACTPAGRRIEVELEVDDALQQADFYRRMGTDVSDRSALLALLLPGSVSDALERCAFYHRQSGYDEMRTLREFVVDQLLERRLEVI